MDNDPLDNFISGEQLIQGCRPEAVRSLRDGGVPVLPEVVAKIKRHIESTRWDFDARPELQLVRTLLRAYEELAGAPDVKQCPRCKGTGSDPVQGHPDHHFDCDLCDGHKFIRVKPEERDEWQPINTCPKDGRRFVARLSTFEATVSWSEAHDSNVRKEAERVGYHFQRPFFFEGWPRLYRNPTHWKPLPSSPTGETTA